MIVYIGQTKTDILKRVRLANTKSPCTFVVFVCLVERVGGHGQCWPSIGKIVEDSGFSRNTVQMALKRLEKQGFISRHDGKAHGFRSTVTKINV